LGCSVCCSWEYVGELWELTEKLKEFDVNIMEPFGNLIGTSKSKKFENCLEINFGIVSKNKSELALA
jgi:hypothetical protein